MCCCCCCLLLFVCFLLSNRHHCNAWYCLPLVILFPPSGGENGSADTVFDPRGFAVKFYTEEGNWDMVGNNTPIFFIRDPIHVSGRVCMFEWVGCTAVSLSGRYVCLSGWYVRLKVHVWVGGVFIWNCMYVWVGGMYNRVSVPACLSGRDVLLYLWVGGMYYYVFEWAVCMVECLSGRYVQWGGCVCMFEWAGVRVKCADINTFVSRRKNVIVWSILNPCCVRLCAILFFPSVSQLHPHSEEEPSHTSQGEIVVIELPLNLGPHTCGLDIGL